MPEELLGILRLCLLALLYLFFLRVVWAVWAELRGPRVRRPATAAGTAPAPPGAPPAAPRSAAAGTAGSGAAPASGRRGRKTPAGTPTGLLVTLQPPETAGTRYEVADECTVGRGAGCQVHLDDTFTSQLHARLFRRDGRLYIEDLASTNGTFVNGARATAAVAVALRVGDQVQVGQTVLEVR